MRTRPDGMAMVRVAGSTGVTHFALVFAGTGILAYYLALPYGGELLYLALAFACVHLVASLATNRAFRDKPFLVAFHACLITIVVLAGIGRLTHLEARFELAEGQVFDGALTDVTKGRLHDFHGDRLAFENRGYTVDYRPGLARAGTRNTVRYTDATGAVHTGVIGDQRPLVIAGYRIYTSFNKGFALLFDWHDRTGHTTGAVHLPSYPAREFEQAQYWRPPGSGIDVWTQLVLDDAVIDRDHAFTLSHPGRHHVVVRYADTRMTIAPGDAIALGDGTLTYVGVRQWMGYEIYYDATRPWLIAACLLAIATLALHVAPRLRSALPVTGTR